MLIMMVMMISLSKQLTKENACELVRSAHSENCTSQGGKWGSFVSLCGKSPALFNNLIASGMYFYLYNELATMTIKKTSATTQSVANTAKRVIVIVGSAVMPAQPPRARTRP